MTTTYTVSTITQLANAISAVDYATAGSGAYSIVPSGNITEVATVVVEAIALPSGVTLTINGNGYTYSGANAYQGFFAYSGTVTIEDLIIANMLAKGGTGGGAVGGGGAGLGGGLFVAGTANDAIAAASVTLYDVTFSGDAAAGGSGGSYSTHSANSPGGGGGGLDGGTGGFDQLIGNYGGGIGTSATGQSADSSTAAGVGIIPEHSVATVTDTGGAAGDGTAGGASGGGSGGSQASGDGGGGGGGGGGGVGGSAGPSHKGGAGGFGAGGDIFVQQRATLTIEGSTLGLGTVTAGAAGGNVASAGKAFDSGIFVQGTQSIELAAPSGSTTTVAGAIADINGEVVGGIYTGALSVQIGDTTGSYSGTVVLSASNTYTGNTTIDSGTLELAATNAAGTVGEIIFGSSSSLTLEIASGDAPTNKIYNFLPGETIDLAGIGVATAVSLSSNVLTVTESSGSTVTLKFGSLSAADTPDIVSNGNGGTDLVIAISGTATSVTNSEKTVAPFSKVSISDSSASAADIVTITLSNGDAKAERVNNCETAGGLI